MIGIVVDVIFLCYFQNSLTALLVNVSFLLLVFVKGLCALDGCLEPEGTIAELGLFPISLGFIDPHSVGKKVAIFLVIVCLYGFVDGLVPIFEL